MIRFYAALIRAAGSAMPERQGRGRIPVRALLWRGKAMKHGVQAAAGIRPAEGRVSRDKRRQHMKKKGLAITALTMSALMTFSTGAAVFAASDHQ